MSVGTEYVKDVSEKLDNGFQMSDLIEPFKENYKEYIIAGLNGSVIGAAMGIGGGLGSLAFQAGTRIAASTALMALGATTLGTFTAGMGIYALETKVFGLGEYNQSDLWKSGVKMGVKGALSFGAGLLLGNQGFYNMGFVRGMVNRGFLGGTLKYPLDLISQGIIDYCW